MNEKGFCDEPCTRAGLARLWDRRGGVDIEVPLDADFWALRADPLAAAIEGRAFPGRSRSWIARVHGVYRDERACWIQLFKDGDATASVVVRCPLLATPDHVSAALSGWVPVPARSLTVLRVRPAS